MPLTIATWNINSVRLRLPIVERFLREYPPDILCLQETKCPDELFPLAAFEALGYPHIGDPRPEGLSRRGDHRPAADRDRRAAPVLRHSRQPPSVGAIRGGRHQRAAAQFLRAGRRRRARSRDQSEIPPQARFRRGDALRSGRIGRDRAPRSWSATSTSRRSSTTSGRTSSFSRWSATRRSRRECFEAMRKARRLGRPDAAQRARRAEALHLVELSRARLVAVGPRPPARPCLVVGQHFGQARRRRDPARRRAAGSGRRTMSR